MNESSRPEEDLLATLSRDLFTHTVTPPNDASYYSFPFPAYALFKRQDGWSASSCSLVYILLLEGVGRAAGCDLCYLIARPPSLLILILYIFLYLLSFLISLHIPFFLNAFFVLLKLLFNFQFDSSLLCLPLYFPLHSFSLQQEKESEVG